METYQLENKQPTQHLEGPSVLDGWQPRGAVSLCAHNSEPLLPLVLAPWCPPTPSPLPGPPASPGLSLDPTGHRNGAPNSALSPPHTQSAPALQSWHLSDCPLPPRLHGSEMPPSCPLHPLILFRIGFPFRTEHQLKPGLAPGASRVMSCGHAAGDIVAGSQGHALLSRGPGRPPAEAVLPPCCTLQGMWPEAGICSDLPWRAWAQRGGHL